MQELVQKFPNGLIDVSRDDTVAGASSACSQGSQTEADDGHQPREVLKDVNGH